MASAVLPAVHDQLSQPAVPPSPSAAVVKLSLRGETFRITFPIEELTWRTLAAKVHDCYDDAHRPVIWTLIYRDDEDDLVTVNNQREFLEAIRVFAELKEQSANSVTATGERKLHMHFHVVAKLSLKEQLAPVMHAVNEISIKMARLAADTRDSLRKSSYVERGRESLYTTAVHTRDTLSSAGRGLSQRVRRASTVVTNEISEIPRRLRTRSRVSSQDFREVASPQSLMVVDVEHENEEGEASFEMDVAALLSQARVEEEEAERNAVATESNAVEVITPTQQDDSDAAAVTDNEEEQEEGETSPASDAETASTASDSTHDDWDIVGVSSPVRPISPFLTVDADDALDESFTRWKTQLVTIRDIMPQIDLELCIDVLDKHNGNLEATLLELTEL